MKRLVWLSAVLSSLLHPALGKADDPSFAEKLQLRLGVVGSVGSGGQKVPSGEHTLGLEVSLPWFHRGRSHREWVGVGPVLQWQRLHRHDRVMLGLEYVTSSLVGAELGWAYWETDQGPVQGIHVTPFFSTGFITVGPRIFIPLTQTGIEVGFNVYLKVRVYGDYPHRWIFQP